MPLTVQLVLGLLGAGRGCEPRCVASSDRVVSRLQAALVVLRLVRLPGAQLPLLMFPLCRLPSLRLTLVVSCGYHCGDLTGCADASVGPVQAGLPVRGCITAPRRHLRQGAFGGLEVKQLALPSRTPRSSHSTPIAVCEGLIPPS